MFRKLLITPKFEAYPPNPDKLGGKKPFKVPRDIQSAASSGFPLKKGDGRGISKGDLGGSKILHVTIFSLHFSKLQLLAYGFNRRRRAN